MSASDHLCQQASHYYEVARALQWQPMAVIPCACAGLGAFVRRRLTMLLRFS